MTARAVLRLAPLWASTALLGCGAASAPARPVASEFIEVDYPPPPAEVEETPEELAGRPDCVWVSGSYAWQGRRWQWIPGEWVVLPKGCARAESTLAWSREKPPRLYYTPARWYRTDAPAGAASAACPAAISCLTRPPLPR